MPPNVFGDDGDAEQTQPGFTWKRLRLGQLLGAERLGASVFELPPRPDITEFPDTGKVGLFAGPPPGGSAPRTLQAFLRRDVEVDYFEGEPTE